MIEACGDFDFTRETRGIHARRDFGAEYFYRDLAGVPNVFGEIHRGHPTAADFAHDAISVDKRRLQALERAAICYVVKSRV